MTAGPAELEAQRAAIARVLRRLDYVWASVLPPAPTGAWLGPARTAYEQALAEVRVAFGQARLALRDAHTRTCQAIARMDAGA